MTQGVKEGTLSVILPAFNEQENIPRTAKRLKEILTGAGIPYELVFVSDGSKDHTYEEIEKAKAIDPNVRGAEFSRNFGKEAAIFAGLELAKGDCCIVMDCDLQHPPEIIPEMYRLWQEGYEVVEGVKDDRGKESLFHRAAAGAFYGIMSKLMKMNMKDTSDYKLLDGKVVDVLLGLTERNTFFRALSFWVGFKSTTISYEVAEREFGKSKWNYRSLIRYAINNVTSFSTAPLQMITGAGIVAIILSFILAVQTLVRFFMGDAVEGFTTVILLLLLIGGFLMVSLGVIGHYIARIYEEVKGRPRYIIRKTTED